MYIIGKEYLMEYVVKSAATYFIQNLVLHQKEDQRF